MNKRRVVAFTLLVYAILGRSDAALAQFTQQGPKLVGTGAVGTAYQGSSVSLSANGNTAIVGGYYDDAGAGAAWVFIRNGGVWTQQGQKLVGTGAVGKAYQGGSVSLSADGNTAIVGGYGDDAGIGAAWVFIRNGGVWTQQGPKLVGIGAVGAAHQGSSVSLSADGNTAILGGPGDHFTYATPTGAAWVFTRRKGVWVQQGSKLVGTGAVGDAIQGSAVSLSADGNIAVVGGLGDHSFIGAAWVFTRTGRVWAQQSKLVGAGTIGIARQGISVSLSADGTTAIVGGADVNSLSSTGAAWVFTQRKGVWAQQGSKLVGTGGPAAHQGISVSLSANGDVAIVGGPDGANPGAAWVFTRSKRVWTQQSKLIGTGAVGAALQGTSVALSGDGNTAIVGGPQDNFATGATWVFDRVP
jgi:hypothetical protein